MDEKKFYYTRDGKQIGPVDMRVLKEIKLTPDDLIWYENLDKWQKIKDIPQLSSHFKFKIPPPLPINIGEIVNKIEIGGEVLIKKEKSDLSINAIKPSNKVLHFFYYWIGINLFALVTSYSEINLFNKSSPRTDKFWPFVKFTESNSYWVWTSTPPTGTTAVGNYGEWKEETSFNGIFYNYDWSEFLIFVGGTLLIYLISKIPKEDRSKFNDVQRPQ